MAAQPAAHQPGGEQDEHYAVKKIDEMEAVYLGAFKRARAELGVESFGIQIIDLPPNFENYPEHDHGQDGQEEVFLALRGGGEIEIDGERFPLDDDHIARVAPEASARSGRGRRHPPPRPRRRARRALRAPGVSKLGEPDPMAASRPHSGGP